MIVCCFFSACGFLDCGFVRCILRCAFRGGIARFASLYVSEVLTSARGVSPLRGRPALAKAQGLDPNAFSFGCGFGGAVCLYSASLFIAIVTEIFSGLPFSPSNLYADITASAVSVCPLLYVSLSFTILHDPQPNILLPENR